MGNVNQGYFNRVQYTLRNRYFPDAVLKTDPIGWDTDEKEYERHKTYNGIFAQFSNSLKFIDDGKDFINLVKSLYGINAEIKLIREEKNPKTDVWETTYEGFLDLSTWEIQDNRVSIKFNSGGLEQSLKNRDSEQVELDRLKTIDSTPMDELKTIDIELDGRNIFLQTRFVVKQENNYVRLSNSTSVGNTRGSTISAPLYLQNKSHENAQEPIQGTLTGDNSWDRSAPGNVSNLFFAVSDRERTFRLYLKLDFTIDITRFDNVTSFRFWCRLAQFTNGGDFNLSNNTILFTSDDGNAINHKRYTAVFDQMVTLKVGDSLGLLFDQNYDGRDGRSSHVDITVKDIEGYLNIDEDSFFNKSKMKGILLFEATERLINITTNQKDALKSEFLGRTDLGYQADGFGSLCALSHGFWIRQFDKFPIPTEEPKVENLFKPLKTSFADHYQSLNSVYNIGIGIEKNGNKEFLVLEDMRYFYNRNVLIRLPNQVKKVKRVVSTENYYSALEFGYDKGGEYDEAMGLDEPNAKSNFSTIIDRVKNTYSKISKYRADGYGEEFARRKPEKDFGTEDTPYDQDNFLNDLKRGPGSVFQQRKWQDDFAKPPTGIFSPDTAINLRLSPVNCLLRHAWWFSACLQWNLSDFVTYGSSTANSRLKTQLIGKPEYAENGDILNSDLETPRIDPEEVEFEHICDFEVMKQVNGTTILFGKEVRNIYGLIEYINENGEFERGFLLNLKPNQEGKWKILKMKD